MEFNVPSDAVTIDGVLDWIVSAALGHPVLVAVLILAAVAIVAARSMGGAVSGVAGRLAMPIGVLMLVAIAIGLMKIFS
jgi:hypothetical protein